MGDLRDAYRALISNRVVSAVAIVSLALGIGANTAIFSILNSLLLRPLPVHSPGELVLLDSVEPSRYYGISYPVWKEIRQQQIFDRAFAWGTERVSSANGDEKQQIDAMWASGNAFDVLGVPALIGRTLTMDDDRASGGSAGPAAVISYDFWQRRFAGSSDVIGQTVTIEGQPFTVVGVTKRGFFGLTVGSSFDVLLPLETERLLGRKPEPLDGASWTWLQVIARRGAGQTTASLSAALAAAQPAIRDATMPAFTNANLRAGYLSTAWTLTEAREGMSRLRRQYGSALVTLMAIAAVVLLIACTNIAMLMLARAGARQYEYSVRMALGSSRARLMRLVLIESLLLAAAGAAFGVALATWGGAAIVDQLSTWYSSPFLELPLDATVLAVTMAATLATALIFGLLPAYRCTRVPALNALKQQPRGLAGEQRRRFDGALLIAQIALTLVLVAGAGLFLRSFVSLAYRDLGFDRGRIVVATVDSRHSATGPNAKAALYERVREAIAAVPGVESAAASLATPLSSFGVRLMPEITIPGRQDSSAAPVRVLCTPVSPGWFQTFGTRILAGRDFSDRDVAGSAPVVIVNEAFARRFIDGAPLGAHVEVRADGGVAQVAEIVGIVHDAAFTNVRDAIEPIFYQPLAQRLDETLLKAITSVNISVRATPGIRPNGLVASIRTAVTGVDRDLTASFLTVKETLDVFYIRERLLALLSGFFGALALLLAAIGLYGTAAYSVALRRKEIGIRLALGAKRGSVVSLIVRRVMWRTVAGVTVGAMLTFWLAGLVRTLLYSLDARDPATFIGAAAIVTLVAAGSAWLPAQRAARVDPAETLRDA